MSNTQYAFIQRTSVPDRAALQTAIDALGFDLKLDPTYTPFEDSGFSPCVLNGREGFGFEIYYSDVGEVTAGPEGLFAISSGRDHCISFVWHSSMNDLACAMIVGSALAKDFGAVVSYEGNPPQSVEELVAAAHESIKLGNEEKPPMYEETPTTKTKQRKPWWKLW